MPTPFTLLYLVPGVIACSWAYFILRAVYRCITSYFHPAPGPFFARFTNLWYLVQVHRQDWHKTNLRLHREHGGVVRIYPGYYSIDDPKSMKQIYGSGGFDFKSEWYLCMSNPDPNGPQNLFTMRHPKTHGDARRKIASLYSMSALVQMEEAVDECTSLFKERLNEVVKTGETVDMQHYLQCFAFDVIGLITLSKRFGCLDRCKDEMGLMPATRAFVVNANYIGVYPWLHVPVFYLLKMLGMNARSSIQTFTMAQINERMAMKGWEESDNFLTRLLKLHKDGKLSMVDVFGTCASNIGAGSDTTSIALSSILWYLAKSPEALRKLKDEISGKAQSGQISDPVTFSQAQNMPYLQAVIREGLRMHPAFGCILGREVPKGGATVAGVYFREGSVVGVNPWVAHYNKDVYGDDAGSFRPERWLASKEVVLRMDEYYLPFGMGSRTCIGKNVSLMQISKALPQIVRSFDLQLEDPNAELETVNGQFVWPTKFFCKVSTNKE